MAALNPFPDLPPDEYDALLADIEKRGIVYPVIRDQYGNTIDGHQREHIAATLGIEPPVKTIRVADDGEREQYAIALNVHRRQLTPPQKHAYILRLDPVKTGLAQWEIAKAVGVSQSTVSNVLSHAREEGTLITTNKGGTLPPSRGQVSGGVAGSTRGGRPPKEEGGLNRQKATPRHSDFTRGPSWLRHFTLWARRALPEQRKFLVRIKEEVDRALALIDEQEKEASDV